MSTLHSKLPPEIVSGTQTFEHSLKDIEKYLEPLLKVNYTELNAQLDPVLRAKLNTALAYTVTSLFFMYLRTQGIDPKTRPVSEEIARVKKYMEKISKLEDDSKAKRTLVLDKGAAGRMIKHSLNHVTTPSRKRKESESSEEDENKENRKRRRTNAETAPQFSDARPKALMKKHRS